MRIDKYSKLPITQLVIVSIYDEVYSIRSGVVVYIAQNIYKLNCACIAILFTRKAEQPVNLINFAVYVRFNEIRRFVAGNIVKPIVSVITAYKVLSVKRNIFNSCRIYINLNRCTAYNIVAASFADNKDIGTCINRETFNRIIAIIRFDRADIISFSQINFINVYIGTVCCVDTYNNILCVSVISECCCPYRNG